MEIVDYKEFINAVNEIKNGNVKYIIEELNYNLQFYETYKNALQIVQSDKDNETIQQAMLYLKADISKGLLELSKNIIKQHKGEE